MLKREVDQVRRDPDFIARFMLAVIGGMIVVLLTLAIVMIGESVAIAISAGDDMLSTPAVPASDAAVAGPPAPVGESPSGVASSSYTISNGGLIIDTSMDTSRWDWFALSPSLAITHFGTYMLYNGETWVLPLNDGTYTPYAPFGVAWLLK